MPQAAVPNYIGQDFQDTPPGHRFGLYFKVWEENWARVTNISPALLNQATSLPPYAVDMAAHLRQRQRTIAVSLNEMILSLPATSISPFMTGTGMEHPLENGFSFLNPYGLPYLPGAGVKGVLRRAAEELAQGICDEDAGGWNPEAIDQLFGREPLSGDGDALRNRGALRFWDVFPEPASNRLCVEIMTPHYGDYYQGKTAPHDSGQPNPILFLTVPPGSHFEFFVQCDPATLPESLRNSWQTLLEAAFQQALDWLGFGAKTAVGYGAMRRPKVEIAPRQRSTPNNTSESAPATGKIKDNAITTPETNPQRWENVALSWNKGKRELYSAPAQGKAFAGGTDGVNLLEKLSVEQRSKLDKGKSIRVTLSVERIGGNNWRITDIA